MKFWIQEEEEKKRKEEEEQREYEEYLKLKETFTVEESGTHELELNQDVSNKGLGGFDKPAGLVYFTV